MTTTMIGLDLKKAEVLSNKLNELLSNFQIHYQNLRGLHWNIKGRNFFELHLKFEELYTDSQEKIDLIAERILTLEGKPLHTFNDYSSISKIAVSKDVSEGETAIFSILEALKIVLELERSILDFADEAGDEGTNAMMSDFIAEQEKIVWMLKAWLS